MQNIASSNATGCPWWQSKSTLALHLSHTLSALRDPWSLESQHWISTQGSCSVLFYLLILLLGESSFLCSISTCRHFNPCLWDDQLIMQNINLCMNAWLASICENKTFIWGGKSCLNPLVESSRENYETPWCFVSWRFQWIDLSDGALVILKATCCRHHLGWCKGEIRRKYKSWSFFFHSLILQFASFHVSW